MVTLPTLAEQSVRSPVSIAAWVRCAFSFPVVLGAVLVAGCCALAKDVLLDPDTWWHITVGQHILSTHSWPWSDTFSWTVTGAPWIAYEWLGEVAIGAAASVAGLRSALLLLAALAGVLIVLLYSYATLKCGSRKAAFAACAVVTPVLGAFFTLRPQLFGAIFLVATLIIVERFREGHERALWLLPPLFLAWVNTHGSFVLGFFVLGVAWLCGQISFSAGGLFSERWRKRQGVQLLLAILASALMLPITPYGTRLAAYPLTMVLSQPVNLRVIEEWLPLGPNLFIGKYFIAILVLLFLALLIERPRFQLQDFALAAAGAVAACIHLRFLLLFVIFTIPLWSTLFARWIPAYRSDHDHPVLNGALMASIAIGLVWLFPSQRDLDRKVDAKYPRAAVGYLANHGVRGRLFNEYGWGGYLIWSHPAQSKVFIDGRADVYEYSGVLTDYMHIVRLEPGALRLLDRYEIETCLIPQDSPLATVLDALPGWDRVYADQLAVVYRRRYRAAGRGN